MLFGDQYSPFITILAVDPHVIIKGIEHNLHGLFRESSINGHDYLRNIVHLPFFLQPSLRPVRTRKDSVGSDTAVNHVAGSKFSVSWVKLNFSGAGLFFSWRGRGRTLVFKATFASRNTHSFFVHSIVICTTRFKLSVVCLAKLLAETVLSIL